MRTVKIILAIFFAIIIYGNLRMLASGDFESGWDYLALLVFVILEIIILISLSKGKSEDQSQDS